MGRKGLSKVIRQWSKGSGKGALLAACESILGGAGMRLDVVDWASYLVLNDGPPKVVARSSFGGGVSEVGTCGCAWGAGGGTVEAGLVSDVSLRYALAFRCILTCC